MQTQNQRKLYTNTLATSALASLPPHLPILPRTKQNIALSSVLILSLSSALNANPNESNLDYNLQGGGRTK